MLDDKVRCAKVRDALFEICADIETVKVAIRFSDRALSDEAIKIISNRLGEAYATAYDLWRTFDHERKLG